MTCEGILNGVKTSLEDKKIMSFCMTETKAVNAGIAWPTKGALVGQGVGATGPGVSPGVGKVRGSLLSFSSSTVISVGTDTSDWFPGGTAKSGVCSIWSLG